MNEAAESGIAATYNKRKTVFDAREPKPRFVNVPPFSKAQRDFLPEGGIILTFQNAPLLEMVEGAVAHSVDFEGVVVWNLYLVHRVEGELPPLMPLMRYLQEVLQ